MAAASNDYPALIQAGLLSARAFPETGTYDLAFCEAIFTCFAGGDVNTASDSIRRTLLALGIEHGLKAKDQNDRSMIALYYLSAMGLYANDARAEEWTRSLIRKDPYWYRGHTLMADLLARRGRYDEARGYADEADRLAPSRAMELKEWRKAVGLHESPGSSTRNNSQ